MTEACTRLHQTNERRVLEILAREEQTRLSPEQRKWIPRDVGDFPRVGADKFQVLDDFRDAELVLALRIVDSVDSP